MLSKKQDLFDELLSSGRFLLPRDRPSGKRAWCLYEGKMIPVRIVTNGSFKKVKHLLKEKNGKYSISLSLVRKEHGNSYFKKKYKAHKGITNQTS